MAVTVTVASQTNDGLRLAARQGRGGERGVGGRCGRGRDILPPCRPPGDVLASLRPTSAIRIQIPLDPSESEFHWYSLPVAIPFKFKPALSEFGPGPCGPGIWILIIGLLMCQ